MNSLTRGLLIGTFAMAVLVTASNILVQFPINDFLTWGAFTYPFCFLVTDLSTRILGPQRARRIVYVGFAFAVLLSILLATPRIALASGTGFLTAQLLDVAIFHHLRQRVWWLAPLTSSAVSSGIDTLLFFSLAFVGTGFPWLTLALGDYLVKLALALFMLLPFRVLIRLLPTREQLLGSGSY